MRVLLLGKPETKHSSCHHMRRGLVELGHEVVHRNYHKKIADLRGEKFDLLVVGKGHPRAENGYYQTAHHLATHHVLFWPDTFLNWQPSNTFCVRDLRWKWTATSSMVLQKIQHATGSPLGVRVVQGAYITEDCFYPQAEAPKNTIPRILFYGIGNSLRRQRILHAMRRARIPVTTLEKPHWGYDLQAQVVSHRAVIGINNTDDVISVRCQTAICMGGRILQEWLPDLDMDYGGAPWAHSEGPLRAWTAGDDNIEDLQDLCREALTGPEWRDPRVWRQWVDWARDRFSWKRAMHQVVEHAIR